MNNTNLNIFYQQALYEGTPERDARKILVGTTRRSVGTPDLKHLAAPAWEWREIPLGGSDGKVWHPLPIHVHKEPWEEPTRIKGFGEKAV